MTTERDWTTETESGRYRDLAKELLIRAAARLAAWVNWGWTNRLVPHGSAKS